VHFGAFCSYQMLWDKPVAIVAYSFGGLVFKSLVVEAKKHVYQRPMNDLDFEAQKYCEMFLNNLKGVVFYSVPHAGGTRDLSKYFKWQCQQIAKDITQSCILKNMKSFNPKMEQLSVDFNKAICKDLNIYAFGEGLPIDNKWVRFSFKHIDYPTKFHGSTFFMLLKLMLVCSITFETTTISYEIVLDFPFLFN
jgi:hypothetical protein